MVHLDITIFIRFWKKQDRMEVSKNEVNISRFEFQDLFNSGSVEIKVKEIQGPEDGKQTMLAWCHRKNICVQLVKIAEW
jgi:hypothetical protein